MKTRTLMLLLSAVVLVSSCATVRQGEVGIKRRFGKIDSTSIGPGLRTFNPFTTTILKVNIKTDDNELTISVPSREGINVTANVAMLYHIRPEAAGHIVSTIGLNFEQLVVQSVFRSATTNTCAKFYAKDMHTSQRAEIEKEIERQVEEILSPRGFEVEKVMLKNIQLPVGLTKSIEEKLQSEQEAQRMEFVLNKERREAERKQIEAEGIRNYNRTLSEGLNAGILQYQYIDAMRQLSLSTNSKVIFSNGNVQPPVVLQEKQ